MYKPGDIVKVEGVWVRVVPDVFDVELGGCVECP